MSDGNGTHINRAELGAHIKGIDQRFQSVEATIVRIEAKLDKVLEEPHVRWRAWGPPVTAVLVAAAISFFH